MEKTRVIVSNVYVVDMATKEQTRVPAEMVFGRTDADKSFPQDTLISRRHFRLLPAEDVVLIEDLGSTNRTKVNGKLLKGNTLYKLKSRDVIEFGQQKFRIFIDGKIVEGTGNTGKMPGGKAADEQSAVFERLVAPTTPRGQGQKELEMIADGAAALEIDADADVERKNEGKRDDAVFENLVQRKNAAWYVQFSGSEFGPLTLKELKVVVKSKQFQGGALFIFTEGLADWLPVEKVQKFLDEPSAEFTATQRISAGISLNGSVTCLFRGAAKDRIEGRLETMSLSEITVNVRDPIAADGSFEIEVTPDPSSGIEPFRAAVKRDKIRSLRNNHVLVFVQAPPRAKMEIERFIRAKRGE